MSSSDKASFIKIAKGAKVTGLTATDNKVIGNADFINNEGSLEDATLERNHIYPGGETWVNRDYDPFVMEPPPDEKFRRLKVVGRWFKDNILAAIIIFILTTIIGIYLTQWLSPPQEQNRTTVQKPKAMHV